jgi:hypothetical protein
MEFLKVRVFWEILPCSQVDVRRYFPITYWPHPGSHRGPVKGRILFYLILTLYISIFYSGPPTHLPLVHFLTYRHPFPIG